MILRIVHKNIFDKYDDIYNNIREVAIIFVPFTGFPWI